MYFIYLAIFILAILTPKIVHEGVWFLFEEDIESLAIFFFGALGFVLYLAREKALLKAFREKLHLQKQTNIITRDLSDSYSYIGEMNRKFDIVKELVFRLPSAVTGTVKRKKDQEIYRPVLEAVQLLTKTKSVALRFVNLKKRSIDGFVNEAPHPSFLSFDAEKLLRTKKTFWEEDGCAIARSPKQACGMVAFLFFPKETNHIDDIEILKIFAAEALFLYCARNLGTSEKKDGITQ